MKIREKNNEKRIKSIFVSKKGIIFSLFVLLFSINSFSQDSIPEKVDLTEETELKFQQFFFKSLSEKSIGNYQKAIENLESCNQILPNDVTVFFEFSKNYLLLNNTLLANEYIERALAKDPKNTWLLKHVVAVNIQDKNFKEAIKNQQKLVEINPKEREFLVKLFVANQQINEASSLMNVLEKENVLSASLKRVRANIESRKEAFIAEDSEEEEVVEEQIAPKDLGVLINQFKTEKSYKILEDILLKSSNNYADLLKFSEEGISLFPAQPFVYLTNAKALNYQKSYKNALTILQSGIDFVIDDKMEIDFYLQMAIAYKGLGDEKEEKKYLEKANKLKK